MDDNIDCLNWYNIDIVLSKYEKIIISKISYIHIDKYIWKWHKTNFKHEKLKDANP